MDNYLWLFVSEVYKSWDLTGALFCLATISVEEDIDEGYVLSILDLLIVGRRQEIDIHFMVIKQ